LQRFLSTGLVLGLLVATAAAFAITESLKLTQSPVTRTRVDKTVSPGCGCKTAVASIKFWLRKPDTITLSIVDSGRHEVARLVDGVTAHRRWNTFKWDGLTASGSAARDGVYYPRIHLQQAHRTIQLPNAILVDTKPPHVLDAKPNRAVFSPDGDGQSDSIKIHYRLSEAAHALLYVRGKQVVKTRFAPRSGSLTWYGRANGVALPQGTYRLRVGAVDVAGNVSGLKQDVVLTVRIRYVQLARHRIAGIKSGTRFGVRVDTDAKSYTWRLGAQGGTSSAKQLVVRAPATAGRYLLTVTEDGHRDTATVIVVPRR
jgi:hypothetical protein